MKKFLFMFLALLFNVFNFSEESTICQELIYLTLAYYTELDEFYVHTINDKDKKCFYDFYDKYINHYVITVNYNEKDYIRLKQGDIKGFFSNSNVLLSERNSFIYNKKLNFKPKIHNFIAEKKELSVNIELDCFCDFPDKIELEAIINSETKKLKSIIYTYTQLTDYQFIKLIPVLRDEIFELNTNDKKDFNIYLIININKSICKSKISQNE